MNNINKNLHIHTVTEITAYIKGVMEKDIQLQDILIKGEISNYRIPGRHLYFSLKDAGALLPCIMFEDRLQNLKFDLTNGLEVVARGSIGVYSPQGRYQLYVDELFPMGRGLLYLALEKLKKELMQKGYFDSAHKLTLPFLPRRISIVTSPNGAAIKDIFKVLDTRFPNLDITVSPCRVQGEEAPAEIARAIENLNQYAKVDVIIVARGGGSMEDLFAFNDKVVADAIYNSRIPIITAIGHEIDQTIADLVADKSAPTPSAAAQQVVPAKDELVWQLLERRKKLKNLVIRRKEYLEGEIAKFKKLLQARHPQKRILELKQRVDEYYRRMRDYIRVNLQNKKNNLLQLNQDFIQLSPNSKLTLYREKTKSAKERLIQLSLRELERKCNKLVYLKNKVETLSPYSMLKRGYSICLKLPGLQVVTKHTQVKQGDKIKVKLYKGALQSQIYKMEER
ncbi:exodeoxyribonuclease VII large subunit [Candidatus Aerophobetes bacterium]|nr:exodeoxyribonuclease VII large subunit [Candidatus Aerophobetes bacterium]